MEQGVRRALVAGVVVIIFLLSLLAGGRLRLDEEITSLLPGSDPVVADYVQVLSRFRALDALYIDVGSESGGEEARAHVAAVADELALRLSQSPLYTAVHYRHSPERLQALLERLTEQKARLFSAAEMAQVEARLAPAEVAERVAADRRALLDPAGGLVKERVRRDPLGFDDLALDRLRRLAREPGAARFRDGRLWSADGRRLFLAAVPRFPAVDTRHGAELAADLERAKAAALAKDPAGSVRIACVGGHLATLDNARVVKADVGRTLLANTVGLILLGVLVFRRRLFMALVFLPATFGMACATLLFGVFDPFISAITLGCGAVLVAITVDYDVHILYRIDNTPPEALRPKATIRAMLLQVAAAAGTTIIAFLCLCFSILPGQRQMGLFAAAGVLGSVLFSLVALAYFIPRVRQARPARVLPLARACSAFLEWRDRHGLLVNAVGLLVLLACALGLYRLRFEGDMLKLCYMSPSLRQDEARLKGTWGEFPTASAMVRGPTLEEALQANDRLYETLHALGAEGRITGLVSIAPILPSARAQEANRDRWRALWTEERRAALRQAMQSASAAQGFAPTAFEPFYASLDAPGAPLTRADFDDTGLDGLFHSQVREEADGCCILSTFTPAPGADFAALAARIRAANPGASVMDKRHFVNHVAALSRQELMKLALLASVAMAVGVYAFFRRLEIVLVVFLPTWLSVLLTLGLLGWMNEPVNLVSSLFIVFIFGVGIDYSIVLVSQALARHNGEAEDPGVTHGAVVICALTTLFSFATLALARHPSLVSIGLAGLLGILASLFAAVLLAPPLMRLLLPHEGRHGTPSLKTLGGGLWAILYLAGMGLAYLFFLRLPVRLRHWGDRAAQQAFARRWVNITAQNLLRFFPYLDSERIYLDATPEAFRPAGVIVSNHPAGFDTMVVLALPTPMAMVVKDWVWNTPLMGSLSRDAGFLLVREDGAEELLQQAARYLDEGLCVMFFPEGGRSPDATTRRFHKGAFELACRTGRDIIPVWLSDTQACTPRHWRWIGDHRSVIRVLPRVTPQNFDYSQGPLPLAAHVKGLMVRHFHDDWRLAQKGKAFWHNIRMLYNYRGAYVESYIAWKLRLDPVYRGIDELLPARGTVLDLGCGYGLMSNIVARRSLERQVIGVDFDEGKAALARRTALSTPNLAIEQQDILIWPFPAADAVLLIDVLHYWSAEKQAELLRKAAACLREGGVLVVRDACASTGWGHRLTDWAERFARLIGHNKRGDGLVFLDREVYLRLFAQCGLTLQAGPPGLGRGSNQLFVLRKGPA